MKILACVKQVPDMESTFAVNDEGIWYKEKGLAFRLNEYDEYAVEEAVALKESLGGEPDLTILSLGPARVKDAIRRAMAMGADRGAHIVDEEYYKKDPYQVASAIYEYAKDKEFDLVFCGMQSQDRGSAQVGVLLSELLGYNCVTTLVDFAYEDGTITATRELEGGVHSVVRLSAPAVLTCQLGLNSPRYPTLPNIMKVKKKELLETPVEELSLPDPRATTAQMFVPEKKGAGVVLEGDVDDVVEELVKVLRDKTTVLS